MNSNKYLHEFNKNLNDINGRIKKQTLNSHRPKKPFEVYKIKETLEYIITKFTEQEFSQSLLQKEIIKLGNIIQINKKRNLSSPIPNYSLKEHMEKLDNFITTQANIHYMKTTEFDFMKEIQNMFGKVDKKLDEVIELTRREIFDN